MCRGVLAHPSPWLADGQAAEGDRAHRRRAGAQLGGAPAAEGHGLPAADPRPAGLRLQDHDVLRARLGEQERHRRRYVFFFFSFMYYLNDTIRG